MFRLIQLRLALAAGILSLTAASAWAFSQQNVLPGDQGNYSFGADKQVTDPNNQTSGQGARPFSSNGPTVQFGIQQGPVTTFGRGNSYNSTPDPYYRSLLNGN